MQFEPVIGLEVHAELQTRSKMFCACEVVDNTVAEPNIAVCPVCAGMPGTLPVVNQRAVEYALRVALALGCEINYTSIFARKNYFYPDLPKGYQISQYEAPLAVNGQLSIKTALGERTVRVRRVHLEEDTGKLTHVGDRESRPYSLLDLNRAGVPLLEIVSEPDMRSVEEAKAYAEGLREILRYLEVNSGDMEKGVIRFEANVSVREAGTDKLNTRVEIKNLNSFRALERATEFEIARQSKVLAAGGTIEQETLGWDDLKERTYSQRSKEEAHDYRYFPEPDLPPLVVENEWVEQIRANLPELPRTKFQRFVKEYGLSEYAAGVLVAERSVAEYFENAAQTRSRKVSAKSVANWIVGDLFAVANQTGETVADSKVQAEALAELVELVDGGVINQTTGKEVLMEMYSTGKRAGEIVEAKGLKQVSDVDFIAKIVSETVAENPKEVASFKAGKTGVANFLFGQAMKKAAGKANPAVVKTELDRQLGL
ncbi:MAG TPA: Asp-tRNA(Asn)/Glu-tRNA(Gln) amidotransferase subunit GatB [Pyrinomonadaceae bacterium]|nr:Asp-tRNA(Asn)/Glu-tRNA(Gln) amidotransferase subunit GatB [Pyrinomonadaceae bacterium]